MIHINTSIEPLNSEEFDILKISFSRKEEIDENGKSRYVYGGWFKDRDGTYYVTNSVFNNRSDNILKIVSDICLDAIKISEVNERNKKDDYEISSNKP